MVPFKGLGHSEQPENGQYVFLQTVAIRALPDDSRMTSDDHRGYYEVPPPEPFVRTAKQPDRLGLASWFSEPSIATYGQHITGLRP